MRAAIEQAIVFAMVSAFLIIAVPCAIAVIAAGLIRR